jgi:hypothetical protein
MDKIDLLHMLVENNQIPEAYRSRTVSTADSTPDESVNQIMHETERAGLLPLTIDGQRLVPEVPDNEI